MSRTKNLKPWPRGVSGNPGGRPRKKLIDQVLEELLQDNDSELAKLIAGRLLASARRGDVRAIQLVAERTEGKPKRAVEVSGPNDGPLELHNLTDEQLDQRLNELLAKWKKS